MKRYLLFAGDNYYPQPAWDDYVGTYDTKEQAHDALGNVEHWDWYQIVDTQTLRIVSQTPSS